MTNTGENQGDIKELLKEVLRRLDRLGKAHDLLSKDTLYIKEALKLRLGNEVEASTSLHLTSAFKLDLTQDFDGLNWYYLENDGKTNFRWSGPGLLSIVYAPLIRDRPLHCRISFGAFARDVSKSLVIFVDGALNASYTNVTDYVDLCIPPARVLRSQTEIGILTESVTQPLAPASGEADQRWLGFQLSGLEVFPKDSRL